MLVADVALAPYRATKLVVQAIGDLHQIVESMQRGDDPLSQLRDAIRDGLANLAAVTKSADALDRHLAGLDDDVVVVTRQLEALTALLRELIDGGADLLGATQSVDGRAERLNELGASIDTSLELFCAALPQLLGAMESVEELEESIETVADTLEPLQATAEKVNRVTQRFSRKG